MSRRHFISRDIGIDSAHRIPDHQSKCRNLHGHRYRILATCSGPLADEGSQNGMVLDFSFLKQEMMEVIDASCDHGMMIWIHDPWLRDFLVPTTKEEPDPLSDSEIMNTLSDEGQVLVEGRYGKTLILSVVPTAENLARHWHTKLAPRVHERSGGCAILHRVDVWETPNCMASYEPA